MCKMEKLNAMKKKNNVELCTSRNKVCFVWDSARRDGG